MKPLFPRGAVAPKKGTLLGGAVYLLVYLFGLRLLLAPLMQLLKTRGLAPTIICESAGTQAEDAAALKKLYEQG